MALDDTDIMGISTMLRHALHELAMAYEQACAEYGEDSKRALLIGEALLFMRGWALRYSRQQPETAD